MKDTRRAGGAAINAAKTHCHEGHPFDVANTYFRPDGRRTCRACRQDRQNAGRRARGSRRPTLRARLYTRLMPCSDLDCECLLWTGDINPKGYGRISVNNRNQLVHRVAWELDNGPIPGDLTVDHVKAHGCRHRNCANVAHLEPVTLLENLRRSLTDPLTVAILDARAPRA